MKLASYLVDGRPGFGVVVEDGVIDVPPLTNGRIASLREALAANALADIARLTAGRRADRAMPQELLHRAVRAAAERGRQSTMP